MLCRRAWPAYVLALQEKNCWLDVQEVVLLCILAQRSVVTFEVQGDKLSCSGHNLEAEKRPAYLRRGEG